jgi:hypothetical protein
MASSGKKKTTMAKLAREARLRERRLNKQAKRDARRRASSDHPDVTDGGLGGGDGSVDPARPPALPADIEPAGGPPGADEPEDAPNEATWGSTGQEQPTGLARVGRDDGGRNDPDDDPASAAGPAEEAVRAFRVGREPSDPGEKEVALLRLRDASDEELAVFEGKLQANALEAGATEREIRDAQRDHPGHGA